jgi:aspartyl-tRNA(Asn)/glutamyl-tRNA(Gln) amidotransferase subunit C
MPASITEKDVRHVAKLSRLKLDDAQIKFFAAQLSNVMGYVAKLNELNVDGVQPLAHPTAIVNRFRPDEPTDALANDLVLANTAGGGDPPFFRVPKVIGDAGGA